MAPRPQTSAAGVLALLSENDSILKQYALNQLNPLVPQFWAEISEYITSIETLYESKDLPKDARDLAALVASKVYYYLAEYDEALSFALGAGPAFEEERRNPSTEEYVETIVSKAIDRYIQLRAAQEARIEREEPPSGKIDPRLDSIMEGIFNKCIEDAEHKQALGIALESARLDVVTRVYQLTKDTEILSYIMEAVLDTGFTLGFRNKVLYHILPLFPPPTPQSSHIHSLTRLHVTLSLPELTVPLLTSLVTQGLQSSPDHLAIAYQIAFDLVEGSTQDFLEAIQSQLPDPPVEVLAPAEGAAAPVAEKRTPRAEVYDKLRSILSGEISIHLYRSFLESNNHADLLILKDTKEALEARSSIFHNALTFSNAFMHSGTASDEFLRSNLDWLGKASYWSKFTATAALGVIHKGDINNGKALLTPYLPQADGSTLPGSSVYSEGGALYALGLVHASRGKGVLGYLRDALKAAQNEAVQHGAALGLGVAGMASQDKDAYEDLKNTLFTDSAIAGEAAGFAMGLIMLGSGDIEPIEEMLQYCRETSHEKIIRGLAVGIAFICYGKQELADNVTNLLLSEKDPLLRYGGVYTLAMSYAGTSNNSAVKKLLHIAVSDTSDDVRRAAVTSLAFLLFKNPGQVPRMVQLLSESYNPHVRCGATLALGISCAGTGSQDAVDLLEPMTRDPVDFVRQGAFVSLAMILVQQSDSSPSVTSTRALFAKVIADKHEDPMARFGAALAQGLIDAGGRNVTISLQSRAGSKSMGGIVGMTLFSQFWYWYPLAHCASLAFEPTAIIGVTEELKAPVFEFVSNAKPSLFAYPSPITPPAKETVEKVATAVLSTTARAKARERTKEKEKAAAEADAMETDDKPETAKVGEDVEMKDDAQSATSTTAAGASPSSPAVPVPEGETPVETAETVAAAAAKKTAPPEPAFETLKNGSRVTPPQLAHVVFPPDSRFIPVRAVAPNTATTTTVASDSKAKSKKYAGGGGILVLLDQRPQDGEPEWLKPPVAPIVAPAAEEADVPAGAAAAGPIEVGEPEETILPPSFEYPFEHDT